MFQGLKNGLKIVTAFSKKYRNSKFPEPWRDKTTALKGVHMYKVVGIEKVSGEFTDKTTGELVPYEYHNLHCINLKKRKDISGFGVAEIKINKRVDLCGVGILELLEKTIDVDIEINGKEVNVVAVSIVNRN